MRITMNERYPRRMQYLDSGNTTNFTSPYAPASPPGGGGGHSKTNASSPAVVAVIGVLAGAFLIISYYRIFLKYCNGQHFTIWGTRSDGRSGGPSTIVLIEGHAWPPDASGLDESLISRIPTCNYSKDEGVVDGTECSVCLGEFEAGEELRILPKCNHPFHVPCIDTWLATSSTCPLCRVNIVLAATVPHALLPLEREPPAAAPAPTMEFLSGAQANSAACEIEILQEQRMQDFVEAGQRSGPSTNRSLLSGHGEYPAAPDAGIPDDHRLDMPIPQHMRLVSLELSPPRNREILVANAPTPRPSERFASPQQLNCQALASLPKRRLHSRARSSGNHKGKQTLNPKPLPLSSPQSKHFARFPAASSTGFTGSSSMNQVVVELLAQEIFHNNVGPAHGDADTPLESRLPASRELSTSSSTGFARPRPRLRQDNASLELMWSADELQQQQEHPCRWSANEEPQNSLPRLPGSSGYQQHQQDQQHQRRESSSDNEMEDLAESLADAMRLRSYSGSDYEEGPTGIAVARASQSFHRPWKAQSPGSFGTWPSKRTSFKHSMARWKRCGAVRLRQHNLRRSDKVHASEPVLEMFRVE